MKKSDLALIVVAVYTGMAMNGFVPTVITPKRIKIIDIYHF